MIFNLFNYYEQYETNPAKKIWDLTYNIALQLSKGEEKKVPYKWTSVFLALGYQGVTDSNSIIYHKEPIQAVFFNLHYVKIVDRFIKDNRKYNK